MTHRNDLLVQQSSVSGQLVEEGGCGCDKLHKVGVV